MASPRLERSGLLILKVRLAVEEPPGLAPRLAATITTTFDLSTRDEAQANVSSVDEILAIVEEWLATFVGDRKHDDALTRH